MCRNQPLVRNLHNFWLNSRLKEYIVGKYRILEDEKVGVYGVCCIYVGYSESKYRLRISLAHPRDCHFAHVQ